MLGHLLLLVEDHSIVATRSTVIFIFLLEFLVCSDDALRDLLELAFALLCLNVVGVKLFNLLQVSPMEVLLSKEIFTLLRDSQDLTILLTCQFLHEFLFGTDATFQGEAQSGIKYCQSDRPHHRKYSTIIIYTRQ
jgi:hypothetical protein